MSLVENKELYNEMIDKVSRVLSYSQGIREECIVDAVKKIVHNWSYSKSDFYQAFGEKLIIEIPFEVKEENLQEDVSCLIQDFLNSYRRIRLAFLEIQKKGLLDNRIVTPCMVYLNADEEAVFFETLDDNKKIFNHWGEEVSNEQISEEHYVSKILLSVGMKLNKSLKYFYKEDGLKYAQESLSRLIQRSKDNNGILCLSIHPLDYLSVSENNHKWKSCLNLRGDYRTGGLSYMQDGSTIVAYLKSKGMDKKLPHFPPDILWNSKKWRCLLYVSDDRYKMLASKQYPYSKKSCLDMLLPIIEEKKILLPSGFDSSDNFYVAPWSNKFITYFNNGSFKTGLRDRYVTNGDDRLIPLSSLITSPEEGVVSTYNDILKNSTEKDIYYTSSRLRNWSNYSPATSGFTIGEPISCLCCEKTLIDPNELDVYSSDTEEYQFKSEFLCESCASQNVFESDITLCDFCGAPLDPMFEEAFLYSDSERTVCMCPKCKDDNIVSCRYCGKEYLEDSDDIRWVDNHNGIFGFFCANDSGCLTRYILSKTVKKEG